MLTAKLSTAASEFHSKKISTLYVSIYAIPCGTGAHSCAGDTPHLSIVQQSEGSTRPTLSKRARPSQKQIGMAEHMELPSPHVEGFRCDIYAISTFHSRCSEKHALGKIVLCGSCMQSTVCCSKNSTSKSALFHCQYQKD